MGTVFHQEKPILQAEPLLQSQVGVLCARKGAGDFISVGAALAFPYQEQKYGPTFCPRHLSKSKGQTSKERCGGKLVLLTVLSHLEEL